MTKRFHIVRITSRGYQCLQSLADQREAVQVALKTPNRIGSIVLRDGNTGKRYSQHECAQLQAA